MFKKFSYCVLWTRINSSFYVYLKDFFKSCSIMFVFMLIIEFICIYFGGLGFDSTMLCDGNSISNSDDLTNLHRSLNREYNRLEEATMKWQYVKEEFDKVRIGTLSRRHSYLNPVHTSNPNLSPEYKVFMGNLVSSYFVDCKQIESSIISLEKELVRLDSKYKPSRFGFRFRGS